MKLLIVEDEPKTGQYLRQGLAEAGFAVELAGDGISGELLALSGEHDLLILDVMLPGRDGWQILRSVRAAGLEVPVLFLTPGTQSRTAYAAWRPAPTTTWSNPLPSPSCWRGCARCCGAATARRKTTPCRWPT